MSNSDQIAYWNGEAGQKWVQYANDLEGLLAPILPEILSRAALQAGEHVLDIGCGGGVLTLEAARRVGAQFGAIGVDVSEPLLSLARSRAEQSGLPARFVCEDASQFRAAQPLDAAISRFGVMFFDDPTDAFDALRRNLRPEGRLVFACWQALKENTWASLALHAALPLMTAPPEMPDPNAPGPFAFARPERVSAILADAGWRGVVIEPWTGTIPLPGRTLEDCASFLMKIGPAARIVAAQGLDPDRVHAAIVARLKEEARDKDGIRLPAAIWLVTATAS